MARDEIGLSHAGIEEQAARWLMLAHEPEWSSEDQVALDSWLDASPAHQAAYWRLEAGYGEADRLKSLPSMAPASAAWRLGGRRWYGYGLAASLGALVLGLGAGPMRAWLGRGAEADIYVTKDGQISSIALEDGTQVNLNTNSGIRAAVTARHREVWLTHGEAYFEVAKDKAHPFVIHSGKHDITVVGTKFGVVNTNGRLILSVVEGAVRLRPGAGVRAGSMLVVRGHVARIDGQTASLAEASPDAIEDGMSWRFGYVHFDNTTLAEAVGQFNRYTGRRIVVDAGAANIRIGGTFRLGNADGFVRILSENYGIKYREKGDELILGE